jgi:hypothetical protein
MRKNAWGGTVDRCWIPTYSSECDLGQVLIVNLDICCCYSCLQFCPIHYWCEQYFFVDTVGTKSDFVVAATKRVGHQTSWRFNLVPCMLMLTSIHTVHVP